MSNKQKHSSGGNDYQVQIINQNIDQEKKKNDELRAQLRDISLQLDSELDKLKNKKQIENNSQLDPNKEVEVLVKEIQNAMKQLKNLNHQLEQQQNLEKQKYDIEKVSLSQSELSNRQQELKDAQNQKKEYQRALRDVEQKLQRKEKEDDANNLRKEIIHIQGLIKDCNQTYKTNEKNYKIQAEFVKKLENKHKEVCKALNAEFQVEFPKQEELFSKKSIANQSRNEEVNSKQSKRDPRKKHQPINQNEEFQIPEITADMLYWDEFNSLDQKIQTLEENKKSYKKQFKNQIAKLKKDIQDTVDEQQQIQSKIKEIETNIQLGKSRLNQLQSIVKSADQGKMIEMIVDKNQVDLLRMTFNEAPKEFQIISNQQSSEAVSFDHKNLLTEQNIFSIVEVELSYYEDIILGIKVVYEFQNKEKKTLQDFKCNYEKIKTSKLEVKGSEYISSITGTINDFSIDLLRIETNKGNFIQVGSERNARSKKFDLQIPLDTTPIAFFGTFDKIQDNNKKYNKKLSEEKILCSFGVWCKKKKVIPNRNLKMLANNALNQNQKSNQTNESQKNIHIINDNVLIKQENNNDNNQNSKAKKDIFKKKKNNDKTYE